MQHDVPLYGNIPPDYTYCFQAIFKMGLKYFKPQDEFSWDELDAITGKEPGMWTWPMAGMLWLYHHGFDVRVIEAFDYRRVAAEGADYLYQIYGDVIAKEQLAHCNIVLEQQRAAELVNSISVDSRTPSTGDITSLIDDGYLVSVQLNSRKLNNLPGYTGHFLLITGYTSTQLIVNDPGGRTVKAQQGRLIGYDDFERAWADPNDIAKNVMAFKAK